MVTEEMAILSVFGGTKSLGQQIKNPLDIDSLIKKGIPYKAGNHVRSMLNLSLPVFVGLVEVSESTWARARRSNKRLSRVVSDRVYRLARIFSIAAKVLEDNDAARQWLNRKQVGLGGKTPLDLMQTEAGAKEVEDLLWRIEYGIIS
jgi:putative toxin-antitoxin system antitoxin component (TIGR02293 family)